MRGNWRAVLVAAACAIAAPSTAQAAPSIAINAPDDPIEADYMTLGVSGTATSSSNLATLHVDRPSAGCAADPRDDKVGGGYLSESAGSGDYSFSSSFEWFPNAGSYLLCAYLTDENQNGAVVATASRPYDVRIPHLSLSIAVPPVVTRGATFQMAAVAQAAERSRYVWLNIVPDTGNGCPATEADAQSTPGGTTSSLTDYPVVGGPITIPWFTKLGAAGSYLACAYFYKTIHYRPLNELAKAPEAAAQASLKVVPPCVVSHRVLGMRLAAAKALVLHGNCRLGRTKHVRSRRYRRGRVTGASVRLGQDVVAGRLVHLAVSTGRPTARRH